MGEKTWGEGGLKREARGGEGEAREEEKGECWERKRWLRGWKKMRTEQKSRAEERVGGKTEHRDEEKVEDVGEEGSEEWMAAKRVSEGRAWR